MKTIIVATDLSETAEVAVKYAALLARFTKTEIVLLNVYNFNIHALNGLITPAAMDRIVEENQDHLRNYASKLSEKYQVSFRAYTLTSAEEESLSAFAREVGGGLIVMGMRRNFDEPVRPGNVSTAIIQNSPIPVLVVPDGVQFKLPERMLFACDYHYLPVSGQLDALAELAETFGAEIQIFHVKETPSAPLEIKEAVMEKIESTMGKFKHSYQYKSAENIIDGINEGIDDFKADILAMSPHKYGFWRSLFHKSKTREMATRSNVPLLALPSAAGPL